MKIGLLTFHFVPNYGASLQCYALWRHLMDKGHEAYVIDYRPLRFLYLVYRNCVFKPGIARKLVRLPGTIKRREGFIRDRWRERIRRQQRMLEWTQNHVALTPARYHTRTSLASLCDTFDVLIAGSDQIWDLSNTNGRDPAYFLDFADNTTVRLVTYGASAGSLETFGRDAEIMAALVKRHHRVSVRDQHTQALAAREFGLTCPQVVDPTWFLDFAPLCGARLVDEDYLLVNGEFRSNDPLRRARRMADEMNLKLVSVGPPDPVADISFSSARQEEWLSLHAHARYVVTNLYHGAIFAIQFGKPFTALSYPNRWRKISHLLAETGLTSRLHLLPDALEEPVSHWIHPGTEDVKKGRELMTPRVAQAKHFLEEALAPVPGEETGGVHEA